MSDKSFEEMMGEWAKGKPDGNPDQSVEMDPTKYVTVVYMTNGTCYEFQGVAMDLHYRVAIVHGESRDQITAFNSDHVLYYEVLLSED